MVFFWNVNAIVSLFFEILQTGVELVFQNVRHRDKLHGSLRLQLLRHRAGTASAASDQRELQRSVTGARCMGKSFDWQERCAGEDGAFDEMTPSCRGGAFVAHGDSKPVQKRH